MLHLHKNTSNAIALGELGRSKIQHHVNQRMLNYWARLVNGSSDKLSFSVYLVVKRLYDVGTYKSRWLDKIHSELDNLGLSEFWHKDQFDQNWFKRKISLTSQDQQRQNWLEAVANSSHCRTYRLLKTELKLEPYLYEMDKRYSVPLCRFRAGNHKLPITLGRYNNIERHARLCQLCPSQEIGDEIHYLPNCPLFTVERTALIKPYYLRGEREERISELFNTTNRKQLQNLSKFVQCVMLKLASIPL